MMLLERSTLCLSALVLTTVGGSFAAITGPTLSSARAGTLFFDTFDDGDHADGTPATWTQGVLVQGSADSSSGDLVLSPNANTNPSLGLVGIGVEDVLSRDTSVRSQVRVGPAGGSVSIGSRLKNNLEGLGYFAAVVHLPNFPNVLVAARSEGLGENHFFNSLNGSATVPLPYDVRQTDTVVQLDVFGDEIRVYAWREGEPMPSTPQFLMTDPTYPEPGFVAASFGAPGAGGSQGIFRYVHAADMPIHELPPLVELPGDYNASGRVEQSDLDLVLLNWGAGTPPPAGWTNDLPVGLVDQEELDGVLLNWGNMAATVTTASVPEPDGIVLCLLVLAVVLNSSRLLLHCR